MYFKVFHQFIMRVNQHSLFYSLTKILQFSFCTRSKHQHYSCFIFLDKNMYNVNCLQ